MFPIHAITSSCVHSKVREQPYDADECYVLLVPTYTWIINFDNDDQTMRSGTIHTYSILGDALPSKVDKETVS